MVVIKFVVLVSFMVMASGAHAEESTMAQALTSAGTATASGISLPTLLLEIGGRLHKTFVLDPRATSDKIELLSLRPQDITYPQLLSLLGLYGLVAITDGTTTLIVPNTDVRTAALPLLSSDNLKTLDDEPVTVVIPVKGISAAVLVAILRPMIPQWGHLAAITERNALVMVDRTANIRRVVEIIKTLEELPKAVQLEQSKAP